MAKVYNVFISHSWSYPEDLKNLRTLLRQRGYFNVEFEEASPDEPINSINAAYIKKRLEQKIARSNIILGIAGMYASFSEWMKWELDTAEELGKPIVGVIPRGQTRISATVNAKSIVNVGWNTESIVRAIRRYAL